MELIGALLLITVFISAAILPWVNLVRSANQRKDLDELRDRLRALEISKMQTPVRPRPAAEQFVAREYVSVKVKPTPEPDLPEPPEPISEIPEPVASITPPEIETEFEPVIEPQIATEIHDETYSEVYKNIPEASEKTSDEIESENISGQDWFSKMAIWIGGVALLMAGFFMIKYSIESGLLTPRVRIWLTAIFGVALCGSGFVISIKSAMSANKRIGQALSGAGIACLYFAAYAAVHLYGFISTGQGFVLMIIVTLLAVALSLKNGAPIAMMGLVGGFLTPWLMATGLNDTVMLFSYLFLLFCGAQFLCIRRGWWSLLLGSLIATYLWSAVVIIRYLNGSLENLNGTFVFLLGISLVNALWSFMGRKKLSDNSDAKAYYLVYAIRIITWSGALVQGLILVLISGFSAVDMALFSILSVGALAMAVIKEEEFLWAAWLALGVMAISVLANQEDAVWSWLIVPIALSALFFCVGHWRGLTSERVKIWRSLSILAALMIVPLLYMNRLYIAGEIEPLPKFAWLWMSAIYSIILALAGEHHWRRNPDADVAGEYSAWAIFLLFFGIWTYFPEEYLAHAAAVLLVLCAWYWKLRNFGHSVVVMTVLSIIWGICMFPYALDTFAYFFDQSSQISRGQDGLAILGWLMGICGLSSVVACFQKSWLQDLQKLTSIFLGLCGFITLIAIYQWLDEHHMPTSWTEAAREGGLTTVLALLAVACAYLSQKWSSCDWASKFAAVLVMIRVVVLHLKDTSAEGESFFMNALLLQFGIPTIVAWALAWLSAEMSLENRRRIYQLAAMLLGFVWVTFLVQDFYGGSRLLGGRNSTTEIYTYSVVWLVLAVGYQAIGLWRNQSAIHLGSLILLLITIGKVFLIDASELEGLYRVLSFLGLGLALIGIGFFYNKVIFARQNKISGEK